MMMNLSASLGALLRIGRSQSVTANNIANAETPGFKQSTTTFSDSGVAVTTDMSQGAIAAQSGAMDVAIDGTGYFVVGTSTGRAYTRSGVMTVNTAGQLADANGNPLEPPISVPAGASSVQVAGDGTVTADVGGSTQTLGQLQLASFAAPGQLEEVGGNLMRESAGSGPAVLNKPGAGGTGTLSMGALEMSNTDLSGNMVSMIVDSHVFAYNVKAIKVQEKMDHTLLNIKG